MISTPLIVFTKQSPWLANYKDKKGIYVKKYKRKYLMWSRQNKGDFAPKSHEQYKVRNSHLAWCSCLRRPYLPHFSSKSYTVWSVGFLTFWDLKWYIACRKWTSVSAPKVRRKTADAVLCFLHFACFSSLLLSFTWLVLMIQKAVKTLKLATNMIRSHC